jgi:hypothetical protein
LVAGDEEGLVIEVFNLEVGADECFFEGNALTEVEVGSLTNEPIVWFDCDTKDHVTRVDARLIVTCIIYILVSDASQFDLMAVGNAFLEGYL